jgi:hypothetical protein
MSSSGEAVGPGVTTTTITLFNNTAQYLTLNSIGASDGQLYYFEGVVTIAPGDTNTIVNQYVGSGKIVLNLTEAMLIDIDWTSVNGANGTAGSSTCNPAITGGTEYSITGGGSPKPSSSEHTPGNEFIYYYTFNLSVQMVPPPVS